MNKLTAISKRFKKSLIGVGIVLITFTSFGFVESYFEISKNLDILTTLYREVNTYYVDDIDPAKFMRTGIEAMLESLDPYTNYISESEVDDYRFMTTGLYGGIGALVTKKGDDIVIAEPYEGYPAQEAGLMAGDILVEIDGKSIKGKESNDVSKMLKGQPNTFVKLLIRRMGEPKEFEKLVSRKDIQIKNVPYYGMVNESIGYIKLAGFTQEAGKEVRDALTELKKDPKLKSIILDLRGNPGGLLHEAVNVSNVFIERGQLVVNTKGKVAEWDKTYKTINNPIDASIPLAVLTNSRSASASEIVSGVIQDLDRGVIVGQRTFGKGLVQTTRPLTYNAQLKVTTAKYYIPSGRCIQALDYTHRNEDGSVGKVPDSLIKEYATAKGRKVYDGGGVAPDFAIEQQVLSNVGATLAYSKRLIFDYATLYRQKHSSILPTRQFIISDEDYADFVAFLSDKDYEYVTKSEKALEDYKELAQKEKYFDAIKADYDLLKNKMMHDKKADLEKFKPEIKSLLREEIIGRYYYQKGKVEATFADDDEIKKAVDVLNNKVLYDQSLSAKK